VASGHLPCRLAGIPGFLLPAVDSKLGRRRS